MSDPLTPSLIDDLKAARANIERGWTQGAYARNADGQPCDETEAQATCFCIVGAVDCEARKGLLSTSLSAVRQALKASLPPDNHGLAHFNDVVAKTKDDVLALFDKTIQRLEAANA